MYFVQNPTRRHSPSGTVNVNIDSPFGSTQKVSERMSAVIGMNERRSTRFLTTKSVFPELPQIVGKGMIVLKEFSALLHSDDESGLSGRRSE